MSGQRRPLGRPPDQLGHYGSTDLIVMSILQSWSQGVELWGEANIRKIWSAANVKVYGAGVAEEGFLRALDSGRAVVLASGAPDALVRTMPWYTDPHKGAVEASIKKYSPRPEGPGAARSLLHRLLFPGSRGGRFWDD